MSDGKEKALDLAIAQIEKNYGKGSIMRMGEAAKLSVETIPTGVLALDAAVAVAGGGDVGGDPRQRSQTARGKRPSHRR